MNRRTCVIVTIAALICLCFAGVGAADPKLGPPIPTSKKIIGWACNTVEPSYLRQYVRDIEKLPIDGIVISVYPDNWAGRRTGQEERWFGGKTLPREDFKQVVADMKATKFKRLTDNFINFGVTARGAANEAEANLDWFDPNWSVIAENGATAAWVAKEGGFKGWFMNEEAYTGGLGNWREPFDYYKYVELTGDKSRTFAQYANQARKRGKEFMSAVTAVYPDITIVIMSNTGWGRSTLVDPFVKGMLDGRGRATIMDGGSSGYSMVTRPEFAGLRAAGERYHRSRVYKHLQQAFGLWVDPTPDAYGGWHTDPADFDKNYRTPSDFENTLYAALTETDKYVWIFTWHPDVWWNPIARPNPLIHQCMLCPHKEVPVEYVNALGNSWKPHDLDWSPAVAPDRYAYFDDAILVEGSVITEGATNLLKNGGLEKWSSGADKQPDGWVLGGEGPVISREIARVKSGGSSVRLTSSLVRGHVLLDQRIPIGRYAGKTLTFGVWVWSDFKDGGELQILDYVGTTHDVASSESHPGDGQWRFLTTTKTIRPNAVREICLRLSVHIPFMRSAK